MSLCLIGGEMGRNVHLRGGVFLSWDDVKLNPKAFHLLFLYRMDVILDFYCSFGSKQG